MIKGLEALIRIEDLLNMLYETDVIDDDHAQDINIIGEALKRLEELEKAFKALSKDDEKAKKLLSKEIEKNRAFEIINEKKVNVFHIVHTKTKEAYNDLVSEHYRELTQEEYDLLKEVLHDDN